MTKFTLDTISHEDGKSHINIHPRGNTRLGRLLSDESRVPVTVPPFGRFDTEAGFKAWMYNFITENHETVKSCNDKWNMLRTMKGSVVKHRSKTLSTKSIEAFISDVLTTAMISKILASDFLKEELLGKEPLLFKSYALRHIDGSIMLSHDTADAWKVDMLNEIIVEANKMQ